MTMTRTAKFALALLIAGTANSAFAQSRVVGVNAAIRNSVQIKSGAAAYRKAVLKERVSLGDDIQTAGASVLQVLLLDRTTFTVGANARVRIDRFVYDPARSASAVGASVAKGAFRFMSGKPTRGMPGQSAVNTPVGSIGIRGTIFEGAVGTDAVRIARGEQAVGAVTADAEKATLIVLRGPGAATQGDEKAGAIDVSVDGRVVAVASPGMALFVPGPGQAPVGPFMISDAGLSALHDLLRSTPNRRGRSASLSLEGNPIVDQVIECSGGADPIQSPGGPVIGVASAGCGAR
jgi:hypothetical protein